jgi:poly(hydroxyalkanoate) depolymerase family esterase
MRRLGSLVSHLRAVRRRADAANANGVGRLSALKDFGSNPGDLDARVYEPTGSPTALVVILHGCTQSAAVYDRGTGWSKLAEKHGFALLFPQQRRANNPNLCFNWYQPSDARRGRGEAASISQMVRKLTGKFGLDRAKVFITGLSAGGAMTSVMLASYPEMFAGGAIIAGLPFATANRLPEALERMRGQGFPARGELFNRAMEAADPRVDRPTVSVWHGQNDTIVDPSNATAIVNQWRDLHGLCAEGRVTRVAGHRHEEWSDSQGRMRVERYDLRGIGHGTPLNTRDDDACGISGPHMLEANICSTRQIASTWGLVKGRTQENSARKPEIVHSPQSPSQTAPFSLPDSTGVEGVIENALRAAGLMR